MSTTAFDDQNMSEAEALRLQCHDHDRRREAAQQTANSLAARVEQQDEMIEEHRRFIEALARRWVLPIDPALFYPAINELIGKLEAKLSAVRSSSSVLDRIEQLEEEIRTVASYAADLEAKMRRIEARAMNGWICSEAANAECEAIARIISGDDVSEGGDPD